jgi:hypothetical protein
LVGSINTTNKLPDYHQASRIKVAHSQYVSDRHKNSRGDRRILFPEEIPGSCMARLNRANTCSGHQLAAANGKPNQTQTSQHHAVGRRFRHSSSIRTAEIPHAGVAIKRAADNIRRPVQSKRNATVARRYLTSKNAV